MYYLLQDQEIKILQKHLLFLKGLNYLHLLQINQIVLNDDLYLLKIIQNQICFEINS